MAQILQHLPVPINATDRERLKALIQSPGFQVLREVVMAHSAAEMVEAMNRQVNPGNADDMATEAVARAIEYRACLEVLDLLAVNEDKWFRSEITPRR